jgi:hypothetical protein
VWYLLLYQYALRNNPEDLIDKFVFEQFPFENIVSEGVLVVRADRYKDTGASVGAN